MPTAQQRVTVTHEKGLHARPASKFVEMASDFEADIRIRTADDEEGNAKSSLAIMSMGVEEGDEIEIYSEGSDSEEAVNSLVELIEDNFRLDETEG